MSGQLLTGEFVALPKRGLTKDACAKFGVRLAKLGGEPVLTMDYCDAEGAVVAQKVRKPNKDFTILGDASKMGLFGQHLWGSSGNRVVITEGELDAVALCQVMDLRWPVVSIPNGASNAKRSIAKAMTWLLGFEEIVLAFDADDAGRAAVAEVAPLFPPGRCKVAEMPQGCKDANEAVVQERERELLAAVRFNARTWRPDGIVRVADIMDRVFAKPETGLSWPFPSFNAATFGRRAGELIVLGAGTGQGKSDFVAQVVAHDLTVNKVPVGVLMLEQDVAETVKRVGGKIAGKTLHVPDGSWTEDEFREAVEALSKLPLFLYDSFGATDWETISGRVRHMAQVDGCKVVVVDPMTAMVAQAEDERKALESMMAQAAALCKQLGIVLIMVSHLSTPENGSHEEGARVSIKQYKGSRAIGYWPSFILALERNQQHSDLEERTKTTLRVLKDRFTGRATGQTFTLKYDVSTGSLRELGAGEMFSRDTEDMARDAGF